MLELLASLALTLSLLSGNLAQANAQTAYNAPTEEIRTESNIAPQTAYFASEGATQGQSEANTPSQGEIRTMISAKAQKYGVSSYLALSLASWESQFNPRAVGDTHLTCKKTGKPIRSRGLWQINSCAWPEVTDEQAFDPMWSSEWAMPKIRETPEIWSTYKNFK